MIQLIKGRIYHLTYFDEEYLLEFVKSDKYYRHFKYLACNKDKHTLHREKFKIPKHRGIINGWVKKEDLPLYVNWEDLTTEYFKLVTSLKAPP